MGENICKSYDEKMADIKKYKYLIQFKTKKVKHPIKRWAEEPK